MTICSALPAPDQKGKVRDIYDLGDKLLLVASDRISAFDVVFDEEIPDKGKVLNKISEYWFVRDEAIASTVKNHFLTADVKKYPEPYSSFVSELQDRSMLVKKVKRIDYECVVRGYLSGSAWKEYQSSGTVHTHSLPQGLKNSSHLEEAIFTPAVKADSGHDENIPFEQMALDLGDELAGRIRALSFRIYTAGASRAAAGGLILADTKFEFGLDERGELVLIDEVLTPDSSRYWFADRYASGREQESLDKQFVRNYLEETDWDKTPPAPPLPKEVIEGTSARYREAFERISGKKWK